MATVRAPAASGRFYPEAADELERAVRDLLAPLRPFSHPAAARAALAPHAGYLYSGVTAAHVFARLRLPDTIVIVAPNHTGVCQAPGGASLWESGAFRTPLGDVHVDQDLAAALSAACGLVAPDHAAHADEHAVEVLLPFIQLAAPRARIVPLILAWDDWDSCLALGQALAEVIRARETDTLLLASSDLNHYESAAVSEIKDAQALAALKELDGETLLARCRRERISMCGRAPAAAVCVAARALGASRAEVVDYRNSGWVTGDESSVVGYAGAVIP
ncbi:MAG TPA: AmmeMemoRadiSam system protein B [Gemmatimonadales bacterium]